MARTIATNFSGTLQFPYATAGTDAFKKEDVQTLALAVDQHNHASGKGLVLDATSIPDGSITSAKIANGTITGADIANNTIVGGNVAAQTIVGGNIAPNTLTGDHILDGTLLTADLAAHAVSQGRLALGGSVNPTTTSTTLVDLPEMILTFSAPVAEDILVLFTGTFYCTVQGALGSYALNVDGSDAIAMNVGAPLAGVGGIYTATLMYLFAAIAAGSHTFKVRWATSGGTATANQAARALSTLELRR